MGVGNNSSKNITLRTGGPLSVLLLILLTPDGGPTYSTTMLAGDTSSLTMKVNQLVQWCKDNNFFFNIEKTNKIVH